MLIESLRTSERTRRPGPFIQGYRLMTIFHILLLAIVQGAAELLPVSSSAHVIVAEKLLGLDPTRRR